MPQIELKREGGQRSVTVSLTKMSTTEKGRALWLKDEAGKVVTFRAFDQPGVIPTLCVNSPPNRMSVSLLLPACRAGCCAGCRAGADGLRQTGLNYRLTPSRCA